MFKSRYLGRISWIGLVAVFVFSFLVPVSAAIWGRKLFSGDREGRIKREFPHAIQIQTAGQYLRAPSSEHLIPQSKKDFALVVWVNPRLLPKTGKRMVLLSNYAPGEGGSAGYALALSREQGVLRPMVFWGSEKQDGRWHSFSEITIEPKRWIQLALTFHGNRFLGVHMIEIVEGLRQEPAVLGGYDVGEDNYPHRSGDLIVGAFPGRGFRGQIGPLVVISKKSFSGILKQTLGELADAPERIPSTLKGKDIKYWIKEGVEDSSSYHHPVEFMRADRGHRREQADGEDQDEAAPKGTLPASKPLPDSTKAGVNTTSPTPKTKPTVTPKANSKGTQEKHSAKSAGKRGTT